MVGDAVIITGGHWYDKCKGDNNGGGIVGKLWAGIVNEGNKTKDSRDE